MGLTVACARCHDHKFDPIPTADYYSLYGVFASSTEPELPAADRRGGRRRRPRARGLRAAARPSRQGQVDDFVASKRDEIRKELRDRIADVPRRGRRPRLPGPRPASSTTRPAPTGTLAAAPPVSSSSGWSELARTGRAGKRPDLRPLARPRRPAQPSSSPSGPPRHWPGCSTTRPRRSTRSSPRPSASQAPRRPSPRSSTGTRAALSPGEPADDPHAPRLDALVAADGPLAVDRRSDDARSSSEPSATGIVTSTGKVDELRRQPPRRPARAMVLVDREQPREPHIFLRGNPGNRGPAGPPAVPPADRRRRTASRSPTAAAGWNWPGRSSTPRTRSPPG